MPDKSYFAKLCNLRWKLVVHPVILRVPRKSIAECGNFEKYVGTFHEFHKVFEGELSIFLMNIAPWNIF